MGNEQSQQSIIEMNASLQQLLYSMRGLAERMDQLSNQVRIQGQLAQTEHMLAGGMLDKRLDKSLFELEMLQVYFV